VKRSPFFALTIVWALSGLGCGVEFLSDDLPEPVSNECKVDTDCGANAICTNGACFARSGVIDEVLLEVVPEANSSSGGLSFLSRQTGVQHGDRMRDVPLPNRSTFVAQVVINGADVPMGCPYLTTGKPTISARVEFSRTGAVAGAPILGLNTVSVVVDTTQMLGAWNVNTSLVPGMYDVYIQPAVTSTCQIPPRILRGVTVAEQVEASAPPATLELPTPPTLQGKVQRMGGTLVGWQVDIIEPQEGRVISTSAKLGPTDGPSPITNFSISYQPPARVTGISSVGWAAGSSGPLIRISPPADIADKAPTVFWDLAAAAIPGADVNGVAQCNLDMSGLPAPAQLIDVAGQVRSGAGDQAGVRSNLQFFSLGLEGAMGLTASFNRSILTDADGRYTAKLFPGQYRVVAIPVAPGPDGQVAMGQPASGTSPPAAITEAQAKISNDSTQPVDVVLFPKTVVAGLALAGRSSDPALRATFEADPSILPGQGGVLRGALAQTPVLPQSASTMIIDAAGAFTLPLDPGDFDMSLRPPESSNFAWWVRPSTHVAPPDTAGQAMSIFPRLPFPVPLEGVITVADAMGVRAPLRNAAVRAYAKVPMGSAVTKVGDARTDDTGRYRLRLPPSFGP
jgi:hypothetical protein